MLLELYCFFVRELFMSPLTVVVSPQHNIHMNHDANSNQPIMLELSLLVYAKKTIDLIKKHKNIDIN